MAYLEAILRRYMCLYWLRPETALWRTSDALAIHDIGIVLEPPLLDLACGDGLNSYVLLGGGEPPLWLDAFLDTASNISRKNFFSGRVDLYNSVSATQSDVPPPSLQIDVGLDLKLALLRKASRLHLYSHLVCQDANWPLPFFPETFSSIFCNALYSVQNLAGVLAEVSRVLRQGGQLIALLTSENFRSYAIYRFYEEHGWEWCRLLDRGRHREVEHCYDAEAWQCYIKAAGMRIVHMHPYLTSRLYQIAEIGLRPLSPVLIRMANSLTAEDRLSIKQEWIGYCMEVFQPMFASGWLTDPPIDQIYYLAVATK